jgi:hypothetical protein
MTDRIPPLTFIWTDEQSLRPLTPRVAQECDKYYVIGDRYLMAPEYGRSDVSHNHQFAWIADAWQHLPERLADEYPSPEVLRKKALIRTGYTTSTQFVVQTNAKAMELAAHLRGLDAYSIVDVSDNIVTHHRAKSQSKKAMPGGEFMKSKNAILDWIAALIGTTRDELTRSDAA